MTTVEKRTTSNQEYSFGRKGEKGFEDINVLVEFCTMPNDLKEDCIKKIKDSLRNALYII